MRFIFIFISAFWLASCITQKATRLDTNLESLKIDTVSVIKDEVNVEPIKDTLIRQELVEKIKVIRKDDINKIDLIHQIRLIEKHEKNTNLRVVDRSVKNNSENIVDTTKGWIAYSVPESMKVSKSYSIKVRISKKTNGQNKSVLILGNDDVINNPQYESVATIDDIRVSGEMSADLRGDSESFNIVTLSTPVQNIDNESYTEWEWIVTPKKSGETTLKLVIKLKDLNKDIIVFNKNIKIKSNLPIVVEGFFEKYWQWLMTTIIIPIFIYFWNRKRKKTKKS
jgi:hypothetical protein